MSGPLTPDRRTRVRYSYLSHLECGRCAARYDATVVQGTCTGCGSPLLARYDLEAAAGGLCAATVAGRPADLWRYHELLPVSAAQDVITLGEGMTPLLMLPRLGEQIGLPRLLMKDEGSLPTGTFKARGAAVGVSRAKELGVSAIAMPTNGNAGAAWAAYAARAGLDAYVVMPQGAPEITRRECVAAGARCELVDGLIGDAGKVVAEAVRTGEYFDASTLKEPYRLEGKKTLGFEIVEQLGWRVPDVIIYPTGGGVGIIGIYKGLLELQALGWIDRDRLPRLVVVQATGCAPIVRAFEAGAAASQPWQDASTVAFGITVPKALGDFLVLESVYETGGVAVAVGDEELIAGVHDLARAEGTFICPEGGATVAAARRLREQGWLSAHDEVVLLNTGAGIKYPDLLAQCDVISPGFRHDR
jgi:threonine synthase